MVVEVFEYPFDLAKVRLQPQVLDNTVLVASCLVQTWRDEGIETLSRKSLCAITVLHINSHIYPGSCLPVPIFGAMAETAAHFVAYRQHLIYWSTTITLAELGLAATGACFLTGFIM